MVGYVSLCFNYLYSILPYISISLNRPDVYTILTSSEVLVMKGSTGKNFETEIRRSLKDKRTKCFWFRIQDTNDVSRFVKQAIAE